MKVKLLVLSDIHFAESTTWSTKGEDFERLIRDLQQGKKYDFDAIIVAGDTFHRKRVTDLELSLMIKFFTALNPDSKPIYTINGNHDQGDKSFLAECFENAHKLTSELVDIGGLKISGMDYQPNLDLVKSYLLENKADVKVIHQASEPFATFGEGLKLLDYPSNSITVVGDTHVHSFYEDADNKKVILSPGMIVPNRKDELLNQTMGFSILEVDTESKNFSCEYLEVPKRLGLKFTDVTALDGEHVFKPSKGSLVFKDLKTVLYLPPYDKSSLEWLKTVKDNYIIKPQTVAVEGVENAVDLEDLQKSDDKLGLVVSKLVEELPDQELIRTLTLTLSSLVDDKSDYVDTIEKFLETELDN